MNRKQRKEIKRVKRDKRERVTLPVHAYPVVGYVYVSANNALLTTPLDQL